MSKICRWAAMSLTMIVGGHVAQAQTPIPPSPKDFAMAVSESDRYEVLAADLATVQRQDPRVRTFAQDMIRDHTRLAEALRQAIGASGLAQPEPGLSSDEALLLGSLQGVRGPDFDKAYARQQELVHAQALAVVDSFAAAGAEPNLRGAARSALPTIRDHLDRAKQLRAALGGS